MALAYSSVRNLPSATDPHVNSTNFRYQFKILMLGDTGVGKTSLLNRFVHDRYSMTFISTIGIDYKYKTVKVTDREGTHTVRLVLWDTAGQERFRTITRQYYRGAQGVVMVYDSTNRATFENVDNWLSSIEQSGTAATGMVVAIVANKTDLPNQTVPASEGEALAARRNVRFFRVSAKHDINVNEVFLYLTKEIERKLRAQRTLDKPELRPQEAVLALPPTNSVTLRREPVSKAGPTSDDSSCCTGGPARRRTRFHSRSQLHATNAGSIM